MNATNVERNMGKLVWRRVLPCGIALAALLVAAAPRANAATSELIPSVGLTRGTDTDNTKTSAGLALRGPIMGEVLKGEIAASYRQEERFDGALKIHQIPVTASVLLYPIRTFHADVGAGWYNTKFEYDTTPNIEDETRQDFGVHLGGGLQLPLSEKVGVDLTGRYVMLRDQESKLVPEKFNPDFWNMSVGLAFRL